MDESFLSDADVIEASRDFVCIRLASYEDESEAEFLRTIYLNPSTGKLDNTVFVLLTPDTKKNLCRPGRGPNFAYSSARKLAEGMDRISEDYEAKSRPASEVPILPQLKDVRLGLNVSSCDGLPSVVCVAKNEEQAAEMRDKLSPLALSNELAGKFVYSTTLEPDDLKSIEGYDGKNGFMIVKPGDYGLDGELIRAFKPGAGADQLKTAMVQHAEGTAKVNKDHSDHVRTGNRTGKNWKTALPVTDPGSIKAMERGKGRSEGGSSRGRRPPGRPEGQ